MADRYQMKGLHTCWDTSGKKWRSMSKASLCAVANAATARENALREALAEALIPLEVLWCQIAQKPYAELTDDLQAQIGVSVGKGRAALEEK